MKLIRKFFSSMTMPGYLIKDADGYYWTVAKPEEWQLNDVRDNTSIFQGMSQDKWGIWYREDKWLRKACKDVSEFEGNGIVIKNEL